MKKKKRIIVLHGARINAGDFTILKRGVFLLKKIFGGEYEVILVPRWRPVNPKIVGKEDHVIILGGPIVSRKLHTQARNIYPLIKEKRKFMALGIGLSGERYKEPETYFTDRYSINFWKKIHEYSGGFIGTRDAYTAEVFETNGMDNTLTGCPSFHPPNDHANKDMEMKTDNSIVTLSIPYMTYRNPVFSLITLEFLRQARRKFFDKKILLVLSHCIPNSFHEITVRYALRQNIKIINACGKSLDEIPFLSASSLHIGTRLHVNIFYLTKKAPSFLFNVDKRTEGFVNTIPIPSQNFSRKGVKLLLDIASNENFSWQNPIFSRAFKEIEKYRRIMIEFLRSYKKEFMD